MPSYNFLVISSCRPWANSIKRYIEWNFSANASVVEIPYYKEEETLEIFDFISARLVENDSFILRNSIAIFDACLYDKNFNPLSDFANLSTLASMLALAFPEIHWIFLMMREQIISSSILDGHVFHWDKTLKENFKKIEDIYCPLFDPTGLRNLIREKAKNDNEVKKYLVLHNEGSSASIDDEEAYAYLHSYIAYKLLYRSFLVTTASLMEKLFGEKELNKPLVELVFEDIFLNFPDREKKARFSDLYKRDEDFTGLKRVKKRVFVTVGHKYTNAYENNKTYIRILKSAGKLIKKVYKPSGGIYNIIREAGLFDEYWKSKEKAWVRTKPHIEQETSHSAPGRFLLIAENLLYRARKILDEANTVQDCIHGALLALEAQELLGYKTPTTCLEAIALKHQLEVKAECMFYGVGYNIDMKNRFKEIEGEVKAVSEWFHPSVRKKSYLNAQLGIITELVEILRDYGQFDEELQCLKKIRKLNRQFYFLNHPGLKFVQPLRAYIDTLVGSFPLFCGALFFWPIFYGLLGYLCNTRYEGYKDGILTFWEQVANSSYTFFGLQPSSQPIGTISHVLTIFTVLTGFLHLGIFISYLYNLIFRK